jgi:hypothetical protein
VVYYVKDVVVKLKSATLDAAHRYFTNFVSRVDSDFISYALEVYVVKVQLLWLVTAFSREDKSSN